MGTLLRYKKGVLFGTMMWDLIIATLASSAQFITSYLGWRVTVDPLQPSEVHRRQIYKYVFWTAGVLGIAAIASGSYLSSQEAVRLNRSLDLGGVAPMRAKLASPHYRVRMDDRTRILLLELQFENIGTEKAQDISHYSNIELVVKSDPRTRDEIVRSLWETKHKTTDESLSPVDPDRMLTLNVKVPVMTASDIDALTSGNATLYVLGTVIYGDTRHHNWHTSYCRSIQGALDAAKLERCIPPGEQQ
jgi:hypothetical protein